MKEARRAAAKADRRGRRVPPTIEDFERISSVGALRLTETLIARHSVRMVNVDEIPTHYALAVLKTLLPVGALDLAHTQLGVPLRRFPASFHGNPAEHLAWGVESTIAACRLLLSGQIVGAAVIARQQLERWTLLLANVIGTERQSGESVQSFIARCWSRYSMTLLDAGGADLESLTDTDQFEDSTVSTDELDEEHEHIELSDGTEVCPPTVYAVLSEIIHGDYCREIVAWEALHCLDPDILPGDAGPAFGSICDALSLSAIQLKHATAEICESRGKSDLATLVLNAGERIELLPPPRSDSESEDRTMRQEPPTMTRPQLATLMPLTVNEGLGKEPTEYMASRAALYDEVVAGGMPLGRPYRDDQLATLAFTAHRYSSAAMAHMMLAHEEQLFGEDFNPLNLVGRGINYTLTAECAALCSRWNSHQPDLAAAASVVSSSLRSAYWLWLEDDDRAMAALRCTLEQTARLRVWHRKPEKASRLEANPATTPRDWIETAGWRRLGALSRALSEFAHAHRGSSWDGARQVLIALQVDPDVANAPFTARGSALDLVTTLAAREVIGIVGATQSAVIAEAMREALRPGKLEVSDDDAALNIYFDHIWEHRQYPVGPPQFGQQTGGLGD